MDYFQWLQQNKKSIQEQVEVLLEKHQVNPVGTGYDWDRNPTYK